MNLTEITQFVLFITGSESETKLVVSLVVIGLLLGTLFVIDLVLLGSKKGFMYGLGTKCSEKKVDDTEFISKTQLYIL